jgi:hypothetical protein
VAFWANSDRVCSLPKSNPADRLITSLGAQSKLNYGLLSD